MSGAAAASHPFRDPWDTAFGAPDFTAVRPEDFAPAFEEAMAAHRNEVARIASDPAPPDVVNTLEALEQSGAMLDRVGAVFWNLASTDSNEALRSLERELAPRLSAHASAILVDPGLFARVDALHEQRARAGWTPETVRLVEKLHRRFVKGGARLDAEGKRRVAAIRERLATLGTLFGQAILKDETDWVMVLPQDALDGLPDSQIEAAQAEARARGLGDGEHAITLARSSVEPFLTFATRRDLRERAWRGWVARGTAGETATWNLIRETLVLRRDLARALGYPDYPALKLADTMAGSADAARALVTEVFEAGKRRAAEEEAMLLAVAAEDGLQRLAPWDWRYYAERVRKARFAIDEAELKPYLTLEGVRAAAFHVAQRLFGLRFSPRGDVPVYHPDVRVFEVTDREGRHRALFYTDDFARPGKRSGAWMSGFRHQHGLGGGQRPLVVNVMNFARPAEGRPALLSFDDARTLFHEFGHALHGMLSDVRYPSLSGTSVARDFVELPSQLYEHWLETPEVLARFARHHETGAPMPAPLIERLMAARRFNQGFATVEYGASALLDLALHALDDPGSVDIAAFEQATLARLGMPHAIVPRHGVAHFQHVFSGEGYAAGYYSYLWSEVLDADAFEAFRSTRDVFDPALASRLHDDIYAAGDRRAPEDAYRAFRGRLPDTGPLLRKRGLTAAMA